MYNLSALHFRAILGAFKAVLRVSPLLNIASITFPLRRCSSPIHFGAEQISAFPLHNLSVLFLRLLRLSFSSPSRGNSLLFSTVALLINSIALQVGPSLCLDLSALRYSTAELFLTSLFHFPSIHCSTELFQNFSTLNGSELFLRSSISTVQCYSFAHTVRLCSTPLPRITIPNKSSALLFSSTPLLVGTYLFHCGVEAVLLHDLFPSEGSLPRIPPLTESIQDSIIKPFFHQCSVSVL